MNDILTIITGLKTEVTKLDSEQGAALKALHEKLKPLIETANDFSNLWVGGWGQLEYNHYHNPNNYQEYIAVNAQYFYDLISKKYKINIDKIESDIFKNLDLYKKFSHHLITELSIIRDNANFTNENELLKSIENFKWGFEPSDYILLQRPNQISVYDLEVLNRGLETPPHISSVARFVSLATK